MDKQKFLKGIKAYSHQQKVLLRLIRMEGGVLTSKRFDDIFGTYSETTDKTGFTTRKLKRPRIIIVNYDPEAFILGNPWHFGDWGVWLELLQIMCLVGICRVKKVGNLFEYRIKK